MVNAGKRMRALSQKLDLVRNGYASVKLPPSPAPQLKSIYMRIPVGGMTAETSAKQRVTNQDEDIPKIPAAPYINIQGALKFRRSHLRSLKFWNPTVGVRVEQIPGPKGYQGPSYMSLVYEATTREVLQQIDASYQRYVFKKKGLDSAENQEQTQSQQNKDVQAATSDALKMQKDLADAPKDEITSIPQVAADPASPQTTSPSGIASPPTLLYTRTVSLPLTSVTAGQIWHWIRSHYPEAHQVPQKRSRDAITEEEWQERATLKQFNIKAGEDRKRVKEGIDAMRREAAELKKAREAAERMAAEA